MQSALNKEKRNLKAIFKEFLKSGEVIGGKELEIFEKNFSTYLGVSNFAGVGNGLDAIRLSLLALGIGPGDEVIVPSFTFVATWLAVIQTGATPIPVDILAENAGMNLSNLPITKRTRAVIYVHLYGIGVDLTSLRAFLDSKSIHLIEDAAQSHGAEVSGKKIGTFGISGCFSFYPTKNLGALGDAGGIASDNSEFINQIKALRSYGSMKNKYQHEIVGWNSRLDTIQAMFLDYYLTKLDIQNQNRRRIAKSYLDEISFNEHFYPITKDLSNSNVWHHFVVIAPAPKRNSIKEELRKSGIGTDIHYPEPAYSARCFDTERSKDFPIANFLADSCISIPIYPWLKSKEIDKVISEFNKIIKVG